MNEEYIPDEYKPHYMRQLRSKVRTPSTLMTIDAFTVKSKKKRNLWNETMDEKDGPEFQSTVRPYAKLSEKEKTDLQIGWSYHKPRLQAAEDQEAKSEKSMTPKSGKSKTQESDVETDEEGEFVTPFVTQMVKVRRHSTSGMTSSKNAKKTQGDHSGKSENKKSVRFVSSKPSSADLKKSRGNKLSIKETKTGGY